MSQPNFGKLYTEKWPYRKDAGVGISFRGLPTSLEDFQSVLMDFSCHPVAAERIFNRIREDGETKTTAVAFLDFEKLSSMLVELGVSLSIVPPIDNPVSYEYDTPFPSSFIPPHLRQ